jgi:hypothetical protein
MKALYLLLLSKIDNFLCYENDPDVIIQTELHQRQYIDAGAIRSGGLLRYSIEYQDATTFHGG